MSSPASGVSRFFSRLTEKSSGAFLNDYWCKVALAAALLWFFVYLSFRNTGLLPTVFADEYTYSLLARKVSLAAARIPDYLFYALFRTTNYCGDAFLDCARILNVTAFAMALPFIFATARTVTTPRMSVAIAVVAIAGPINSYTAYFMPESLYFLSFWIVAYLMVSLRLASNLSYWTLAGFIYGLSALVKPHAFLYAPALILYIAFLAITANVPNYLRRVSVIYVCFFASALGTKLFIGYLLAGRPGLTVFGSAYGSMATVVSLDHTFQFLTLTIKSLEGHLLVLALIYGLPLSLAIGVIARQVSHREAGGQIDAVNVFSILILSNLVLVTAVFTAAVVGTSPYESVARLHMRYYNFALPLFYMIAAGFLSRGGLLLEAKARYALAALFSAGCIYALWTHMSPFLSTYVDSPELHGIYASKIVFGIVGGVSVLALVVWAINEHAGLRMYLFAFVPLTVVVSGYYVVAEQRSRLTPDVYDRAGLFSKQYLRGQGQDTSGVIVVGPDPGTLYRTLFYLDSADAALGVVPSGDAYQLSTMPEGKKWVLRVGPGSLVGRTSVRIPLDGFSLVRVPD